MKKILIATCILSLATISPVFAKNITTSAYKIASAGYTSSSSNGPGSGYNNGPGSGYTGFTNGYSSVGSGYQSSNGQESLSGDAQKLQQWLDANPEQAQQIQAAIQNSPDKAAALKKWLEAHPEQAAQIKGLF